MLYKLSADDKMNKKEMEEKIKETMVFNSPDSSVKLIIDIIQQEIDRAREEERQDAGVLIDDLRYELEQYYLENPPKGYVQYLDIADMFPEDMQRMVEDMTDDEVREKCTKYKIKVN